MRDLIFKHFSLQLQNIQHWDKVYGVSFNNLDLSRQTFCICYCVKDFQSLYLLTSLSTCFWPSRKFQRRQNSTSWYFAYRQVSLETKLFSHYHVPTWQQTGKRVSHGKLHLFSGADKEFHLLVVCFVLDDRHS